MSHTKVASFEVKFPNTRVSSSTIFSLLGDAEEWVTSCLAEMYATPFSDSNLTFTRLSYSKAFHFMRLRSLNPDDSDEMGDNLQGEIDALRAGTKVMVMADGSFLSAQIQTADKGQSIFSNTMNYKPTFDEDLPERQRVDRDKITDLRIERK